MYRSSVRFAGITVTFLSLLATLQASVTGLSGGSQPFSNMQPSLGLSSITRLQGVFPSQIGGTGTGAFQGQIKHFAGSFAPGGWVNTDGQILTIAQNTALFALLTTSYGGNGQSTFALPDLRGRVAINDGAGAGLSPRSLGEQAGVSNITLTAAQMPAHTHSLPGGGTTSSTGGSQPLDNMQPSLAINYIVNLTGDFPTQGQGGVISNSFIGEVAEFGGSFAPAGWAMADGQLLPIQQNQALFSVLGGAYGGDGVSTFALPDLRGRVPVGFGTGPGLSPVTLGQKFGAETTTLTQNQLAVHNHALPPGPDLTGDAGGGLPVDNHQPELGMNYIIVINGNFPPRTGDTGEESFLGEVALFAGGFAPDGWALAQGQLLPIAQNTALFSLLGVTYGGNGQTTFALPDLRGRAMVHPGTGPGLDPFLAGQIDGHETTTLLVANLPAHLHDYVVPEPTSLTTGLAAFVSLFGVAAIRRGMSQRQ